MKIAIRGIALSLALVGLTFAGPALAAPTAEELFAKGEAAMKKKDYDTACTAFATSYQLSDGKGALYKLAQCDDARGGRLATQLKNWKEVRDRFPEKPEIVAEAETRIRELSGQVGKLTLRRGSQAPKDLRAEIDGRESPFDTPIPVDSGRRSISGTSPGGTPIRQDIIVRDGESQTVTIGPNGGSEPTPPPPPPPPPPGGTSGDATSSAFPWTTAGFVAGGVGVAGLAVFALSAAQLASASGDLDDLCPAGSDGTRRCSRADEQKAADLKSSGEAWQVPNVVGLVVGIVGVGAGVTFLVVGAQSDPSVEASIGPGHVGVRGAF